MCALRSPRELLKQPIYELLEIERNLVNKNQNSKQFKQHHKNTHKLYNHNQH